MSRLLQEKGGDIHIPSQVASFMHNVRVGLKLLPLFHLKSAAGCCCESFVTSFTELHVLMLILLLKFRGATNICLRLPSITVLRGSLSVDQLSLTDAEREKRVRKARADHCKSIV